LRNFIAAIAISILSTAAIPSYAETPTPKVSTDTSEKLGWIEAVITTQDPAPWIDLFTEHAGWEVRSKSKINAGLAALWNLPDTAKGREILLANKGSTSGFIRLIHLKGVDQDWIRANDRPWDTGGIFDLNLRVVGMNDLRDVMLAAGWQGDSEPIQYQFGPFEVIEWILRGPDGVRFALIERLKPTLEGYPNLKIISRTINATQIVKDMAASRAFYEDVLGMEIYLEHSGPSDKPGPNVLGLTYEDSTSVTRNVYIYNRFDPQTLGSIELLSYDGASGADLSAKAAPHNLGLSVLRFEVNDLAETMRVITSRGGEFVSSPIEMKLAPYGDVKIAAMTAPEGARLEFFERIK